MLLIIESVVEDGGAHSRHSGKMDEQLRDDYHIPPNPTTTLPKPTTTMAHKYKQEIEFLHVYWLFRIDAAIIP